MDKLIRKDKQKIDKMMDDLIRKDKPRDKIIDALMALAASYAVLGTPFTVRAGEWFIAFSMCALAMLKLQNVESFSSMFLNYDLLAKRWVPYANLYPFAEALAGILMISGALSWISIPVALFIGIAPVMVIYALVRAGRSVIGIELPNGRREIVLLPARGAVYCRRLPLDEAFLHGEIPVTVGFCVLDTHTTMPKGPILLGGPLQQEANEVANQRLDNVSFVLNKRWLVARGAGDAKTFVPRRVYGDYLRDLLMETIAADPARLTLARMGSVLRIRKSPSRRPSWSSCIPRTGTGYAGCRACCKRNISRC